MLALLLALPLISQAGDPAKALESLIERTGEYSSYRVEYATSAPELSGRFVLYFKAPHYFRLDFEKDGKQGIVWFEDRTCTFSYPDDDGSTIINSTTMPSLPRPPLEDALLELRPELAPAPGEAGPVFQIGLPLGHHHDQDKTSLSILQSSRRRTTLEWLERLGSNLDEVSIDLHEKALLVHLDSNVTLSISRDHGFITEASFRTPNGPKTLTLASLELNQDIDSSLLQPPTTADSEPVATDAELASLYRSMEERHQRLQTMRRIVYRRLDRLIKEDRCAWKDNIGPQLQGVWEWIYEPDNSFELGKALVVGRKRIDYWKKRIEKDLDGAEDIPATEKYLLQLSEAWRENLKEQISGDQQFLEAWLEYPLEGPPPQWATDALTGERETFTKLWEARIVEPLLREFDQMIADNIG